MTLRDDWFRYLDHLGETHPVRSLVDEPDVRDRVVLRHDVDHDIDVALEMAWWEHRHGRRASYYLLDSAPYWQDPRLADKCRQLADFGHEVGLHVNALANWYGGRAESVDANLRDALATLRAAGVEVVGACAHGDPLCYRGGFANYWCFSELRPDDPVRGQHGITAEGTRAVDDRFRIDYPAGGAVVRADGERFAFWSLSMREHGLVYDAMHLPVDAYYTDSGGEWRRSGDPLQADVRRGRVQVLMHPESWRAPARLYFFLSTARSGSTWTSRLLDAATPFSARHEFLLNHRFENGRPVPDKRTADGFAELAADPPAARDLLLAARDWVLALDRDYAECNVYLERFVPQLRETFPEAVVVHLHRRPEAVVRSLLNRGWYETPDDDRHPAVAVDGWAAMDQLEKACCYVADVNGRLAAQADARVALETLSGDPARCAEALAALGVPFYPRLAAGLFEQRVNATEQFDVPAVEQWSDEQRAVLALRCGATAEALGYEGTPGAAATAAGESPAPASFGPAASRYGEERLLFESAGPVVRGSAGRLASWLSNRLDRRPRDVAEATLRGRDAGLVKTLPVTARRATIEAAADGLLVQVPAGAGHAHVVLGGADWHADPQARGLEARLGAWYHGEIDVSGQSGSDVTLFCLVYGEDGRLLDRRSLVRLSPGRGRRSFGFKTPALAHRFCLALYAPSADTGRVFTLARLRLTERLPAQSTPRAARAPAAPASRARVPRLPAAARAWDHLKRYRVFFWRLLRETVLRYPAQSAVNYALTTGGLGLVGVGFLVVLTYFRAMGKQDTIGFHGLAIPVDGSPAALAVLATVACLLFACGAVVQYAGRRRTLRLMGRHERLCALRVLRYGSRCMLPLTLSDGTPVDVKTLGQFLGRTPRIASRLMFILSNLLRDVVIFALAFGGLFLSDALLATVVSATLLLAVPFFYRTNLFAISEMRRFDRNSKPAMQVKRELMRDLVRRPTPLPESVPTLHRAMHSGPVNETIDAFGGRLLALERTTFVATLLAGVLFFEIVLVMGSRLGGDHTAWASLVAFIVALQFFVLSLMRVARSFTSINRFYPWMSEYLGFVEHMERSADTRRAAGRAPGDAGVRTDVRRIDASEDRLVLQAGVECDMVACGGFDRHALSTVVASLPGPVPGVSPWTPWWVQAANPESPLNVREFVGLPPGPTWADLRATLVDQGCPAPLPEAGGLDLDAAMPTCRALRDAGVALALGTVAMEEGGADPVFIAASLWQSVDDGMRAWVRGRLADRLLLVVQEGRVFEPSPAAADGVLLHAATGALAWCTRSHLERHPELLIELAKGAARAEAVLDALDDEEDL